MKKDFACINCPRGCHLTAERQDEQSPWDITGNSCPAGLNYAQAKLSDSSQIVSATIRTNKDNHLWLSVKTDKPFPKDKIPALLERIYKTTISAPLNTGDVIMKDIDGTGVNLIASESL